MSKLITPFRIGNFIKFSLPPSWGVCVSPADLLLEILLPHLSAGITGMPLCSAADLDSHMSALIYKLLVILLPPDYVFPKIYLDYGGLVTF